MSATAPLGATPQNGAYELERAPFAQRVATREWVGPLALGALLLTGLVISLSAASTDALLPQSIRPIPTWLAGPFGSTGFDIHAGGAMAALAVMFLAYVFAVRHAERVSPKAVLTCVAALLALVLLAPPLLSTDVFSYGAYGRMGVLYGANPYLHGPYAISLDPVYPFIGAKWVNTPSVYGPLFTAISYVFAPLSIAASVLTYKVIAAVAALVVVVCVWHSARWRGINPVRAVALVGLNPMFVLYGVGGAHNDLLMLAASTAALWAILQRRNRAGGGLLAAATWIKLTGGLLVPFALVGAGKQMRRSREIALGAAAVTAVVAVTSFALFGTAPLHLPGTIAQSQAEGDWHSIPGFFANGLGLATVGHVIGIVLAVAFASVCLLLLRSVRQGRLDWLDGAGWATLAMLITASSLLPWYVAWLLPLAAISADERLRRSAVIATGVMLAIQLIGFIPHVTTTM
jgi:hypothetical protein